MTKEEQKKFKARAHSLKPVVIIGHSGLTEAVLAEIGNALDAHELIKIKIQMDEREQRKQIIDAICKQCTAEFIQNIGKILTIYKRNPDK